MSVVYCTFIRVVTILVGIFAFWCTPASLFRLFFLTIRLKASSFLFPFFFFFANEHNYSRLKETRMVVVVEVRAQVLREMEKSYAFNQA